MLEHSNQEDKYVEIKVKRQKHVDGILQSKSDKKIVVAGPGTGKTFLFKKVLGEKKKSLTITFINSLVEDLSLELFGVSDVKTLHSFARSVLSTISKEDIKIHPKLSKVIKVDAKILLDNADVDFDNLFYEMIEDTELIKFFKTRKDYYKYYGYTDIVYAVVKLFEKSNDRIPFYNQIVVDEFQDFNLLEVSLIDFLSEKSPILLAGDDDQALYNFKKAKTDFIRAKFIDKALGYENFTLPYCSRCTKVIVDTTNDIIKSALKHDFLKGRINKPYIYFNNCEKDKECESFPQIGYTCVHDNQIAWFIENKIEEMAKIVKDKFSVLIISPFKKQSQKIAEGLINKGFKNIQYNIQDDNSISVLDGIKLLIENKNDNLGWRIISQFFLEENDFIELIKKTDSNPEKQIHELISKSFKNEINKLRTNLIKIINKKNISDTEFNAVFKKLNINSVDILRDYIKKEIDFNTKRKINSAINKIPIKATTVQSSKGLSGDLVFLTQFDDRYFIQDKNKTNISDQDICNFLVSITRAKKKLFLISTVSEKPTFFRWIDQTRLEILT